MERASLPSLDPRQQAVLRAVVAAYVGGGAPVGSGTVASLLAEPLSSASIRNTMAELAELGLLEKPHPSAGRIPTERGLRVFVDALLDLPRLGREARLGLAGSVDAASPEAALRSASRALSEWTEQLGFVVAPALEAVPLRHVSLVRLSADRLLAVVVAETGRVHQRVLREEAPADPAELDRLSQELRARVAGRTLGEVRAALAAELARLREDADRLARRAVLLGLRALRAEPDSDEDLVVATRLAVLERGAAPDPDALRRVLGLVEARRTLLRLVEELVADGGVRVAFGEELAEPGLRRLALVAAPYGPPGRARGAVGVLGADRMDYARVIPVVGYLSELLTEQFGTS